MFYKYECTIKVITHIFGAGILLVPGSQSKAEVKD